VANRQQHETLEYFRSHAEEWERRTSPGATQPVNITKQRNDFVLDVVARRAGTASALDVGCGPGDLVLDLAREGIDTVGIDFAPEMIRIAEERAEAEGVQGARFVCGDVFSEQVEWPAQDCISANGFIEYISGRQLRRFLEMCRTHLRPDGSLVLGSRNRLFNVFSLNAFTMLEIQQGAVLPLLSEAIALAGPSTYEDLLRLEVAPVIDAELDLPRTGIDVATRLQYTPVQLMKLLAGAGFRIVELAPVHIHAIAPRLGASLSLLHVTTSAYLHAQAAHERAAIPQASSFMVHAVRIG